MVNNLTPSLANVLGVPLVVQGTRLVLVPDILGPIPVTEQHEYVEVQKASHLVAALQVRESDIEHMRQMHPGVPVYGLWQILIASQCITDTPLQILPLNSLDGFYIYVEQGRALYSGQYQGGFFAAQTSFSLTMATEIQIEITKFIIPNQQAFLAQELLQKSKSARLGFVKQCVTVLFCIVFFGFIADFSLQILSESAFADIVEQERKALQLESQLKFIAKNKLIDKPNQSIALDRLAVLMHDFKDFKFVGTADLRKKSVQALLPASADPSLIYQYLDASMTQTGVWHIKVQLLRK